MHQLLLTRLREAPFLPLCLDCCSWLRARRKFAWFRRKACCVPRGERESYGGEVKADLACEIRKSDPVYGPRSAFLKYSEQNTKNAL